MNKGARLAAILFLCAGVFAGQKLGLPIVSGICIVEDDSYRKDLPPGKLTIGFDIRSEALYKISFKNRIVYAGQARKGFHTFAFHSPDFFKQTDTHRILLDLKSGSEVVSKEILINIRLIPLYLVQKAGGRKKQHVYTLSFLIGDQLIYSTRKFAPRGISFELDLPPWEGRYNPFGLIAGTQKPVSGVPILGAVAGIYNIAKYLSMAEEKPAEKTVPQKKQRIETTFLKANAAGDTWQWKALVQITAQDLGKDPRPCADILP